MSSESRRMGKPRFAAPGDVGRVVRRRRAPGPLLLMAVVASGQGCTASPAAPQLPGRQLISRRDLGDPFFFNPSTVAFIRPTQVAGGLGEDIWVLPPDDPAGPELAAVNINFFHPYTLLGDLLVTGERGEQVFDLQARSRVSLDLLGQDSTAPSTASGVTLSGPEIEYSAVRRDGGIVVAYRPSAAGSSLFVGRPPAFAQIADIVVTGIDFLGADLAVLGHPAVARDTGPPGPTTDSLFRMTIPSGALTELPVPTFAPTTDFVQGCGAFPYPCFRFRVVGCREDDAPCPGSDHAPCAILYQRTVEDGSMPPSQQPFAYDVLSGQEIALSGLNPAGFWISPDQHKVAWMPSRPASSPAPGAVDETAVHFRDLCTGDEGQCSLLEPLDLGWRSDSEVLAATLSGGLALVRFPGGECTVPDGLSGVADWEFSPGNQHLVWLESSDASNRSVWISDDRGDGARVLATGRVQAFQLSPDGQRASVTRYETNGLFSKVWVNLADDPPVEHPLVAAAGYQGWLGNRRALVLDRWNTQDANGTLVLLDLDGGSRQDLARSVSGIAIAGSPDDATEVAYLVHGRFASNQDGLWRMTLPAPP